MEKTRLNTEQSEAVKHENGPMLVVAGAGTGKTTILIERLKQLVENKKAKGEEILLLTFTEKGAGEMKDRAELILPYGYFDLWISTFHGFCERVLREHALDIGLNPDFKLLATTEQWIMIKKNLDLFELDYYKPLGNPTKFIYELVKYFSRLKDEYILPNEYSEYAKTFQLSSDKSDEKSQQESARINELANAYQIYRQLLLDKSCLDFGDLITFCLELFEKRPAILDFYREKFKFIMIDEFQDTNWSQYALIKTLAFPKNNLMVVGDDDQSIYKFRGASLSNILQFKDDYPDAKEVVLTRNYRSGQKILDLAYGFIKHNNPNRLEERIQINKKLVSGLSSEGEVRHINFASAMYEQNWVANEIRRLKTENDTTKWSDFAILVRANSTADDYVAELTRNGIPNVFVSLRGLYFKSIILDCVAYLKLLDHYHESSALFRVLNMDIFKVEHKDLVNISRHARRKVWSLFEALKNIDAIPDISPLSNKNIKFLLNLINKHSQLTKTETTSRIFARFVHDAGLDNKEYHENMEYFSFLNQFYQRMTNFEKDLPGTRLKDFLELLDLELEAGETGALRQLMDDEDKVSIMTVHSSKGLEFKHVFIVNLVDKKFPSISRSDKIDIPESLVKEKGVNAKNDHIEEERRLFYVALTRAKEGLYLSSAKDCGGLRDKKPSIFILESEIITEDYTLEKQEANLLLRDIKHLDSPLINKNISIEVPKRFSFSQIEAYANCPLQYKFNFILKIPVLSKPVLAFGRLMHNTLKDSMSGLIENRQASMFEVPDLNIKVKGPELSDIIKNFNFYWSDDGYEDIKQREDYKKMGKEMLTKFHEAMEISGWPKVMFIEKAFVYKIGDNIFRGSIDRIDRLSDGSVEIIDYKTGNPNEKISYKEKRQLILYKLALEDGLGLNVSKLSFFYLKNASTLSFKATIKDEDKLRFDILESINKIKLGDFSPKPSFLCDYCDFNSICEFRQMN